MILNPPEEVQIERVVRSILSDKPRITKFNINWDNEVSVIPSFNNYNFMFDEGKKTSDDIQSNYFNQGGVGNINANNVKNIFLNLNSDNNAKI